MAVKQVMLTKEGLEKYQEELETLRNVKRKEVSVKIKVALSLATFPKTVSMMRPRTNRQKSKPVLPIWRLC